MKLEQPGERTRHLGGPFSWAQCWLLYKQILPLVLFCSLFTVEGVLLKWLDGTFEGNILVRVSLAAIAAPVVLFLAVPLTARLSAYTKRKLEFRDKHILISPDRLGRVRWDRLLAFQLESIPCQPDLVQLNVVRSLGKNQIPQRKWSIILDRATQLPLFLEEAKRRQQQHPAIQLQEFDQPLPRPSARTMRGMVPYILGFWLLLHGILPLIALVGSPASPARQSEPPKRPLSYYFKSREQFRRTLLVGGVTLTCLGGILFTWGCVRFYQDGKSNQAKARQDFLDETARTRPDVP